MYDVYVQYIYMYGMIVPFELLGKVSHSRTVRDFWIPLWIDLLLPSGETSLVANFLWSGTATNSACLYFYVFFFSICPIAYSSETGWDFSYVVTLMWQKPS